MSLERISVPSDARFWPQAARAVIDFASKHGLPAQPWHALTWLVPGGMQAPLARAALRQQVGPRAFIPPRIAPLAAWLGRPLRSGTAARAELFSALRARRPPGVHLQAVGGRRQRRPSRAARPSVGWISASARTNGATPSGSATR